MKKYVAWDGVDYNHEEFDTIEEAQKYLEKCFFDDNDRTYSSDLIHCGIYELCQKVSYDVIDKKENYKYEDEDDIPEDDEESEAWPYSTVYEEIWQHKFVDVKEELK